MATMLAAVLSRVDAPLELEERPIPTPGPGEVRVRVEACGVCGSDLFLQKGGFGAEKLPVVPGHEAAGRIDAVGSGVTGWQEGEQVALYYIDAAPDGRWTQAGRPNLEPGLTRMGVDVDGAFAQYVVRPAHTLVRPSSPIDAATLAVLTDAVATPYHALGLAAVKPGETVLVLGVGGIGSNAVQLARVLGAGVIAASRSAQKLALAQRLGADATVALTGDPQDDAAAIRGACAGGAPDVIVQCVGSPLVDELALACAGVGARVVLVGAASEPFRARSVDLIWRELTVIGARGFTPDDIRDVVALFERGAIEVGHLTAVQRPLAQVNGAMDDLRTGRALRTVLLPHGA
jgi:2-desacetyl-2-hydroxyethyl bacteriochlorophyllide A dehydrogenase